MTAATTAIHMPTDNADELLQEAAPVYTFAVVQAAFRTTVVHKQQPCAGQYT